MATGCEVCNPQGLKRFHSCTRGNCWRRLAALCGSAIELGLDAPLPLVDAGERSLHVEALVAERLSQLGDVPQLCRISDTQLHDRINELIKDQPLVEPPAKTVALEEQIREINQHDRFDANLFHEVHGLFRLHKLQEIVLGYRSICGP